MRLQLSLSFLTCWTLKEKSSQLMQWVARKILQRRYKTGGGYLFAVKGNQGRINKAFEEKLPLKELNNPEYDRYAMSEKSHGREEIRLHIVCDVPDELIDFIFEWKGLK